MKARAHYLLREEDDDQVAWEIAAGSPMFNPRELPALTAWLNWGSATDNGTLSVPDLMGGSPATQSTGALKPTRGLADNGVPIGTFSAHVLSLPLSAAINGDIKFGIAFWLKVADVVGLKTISSIQNNAGGASANKLLINTFGAGIQARAVAVDRRATPTIASIDTNWRFCYIGIDCSKLTEATQVIMNQDGPQVAVSFTNDTAWPVSLGTPTGNMLIGANTSAAGSPLVGSIGDIYFFSDQLTTGDVGRLMQFNPPL